MRYLGKNVLITGSRRGVGHILCKHFLEQGATVIGLNRHADDAFSAPSYHPLVVDIGQSDSLTPCFGQIRHEFGHLDIVINNAGVLTSQYAMILAATAARAMLETNVLGTFLVSREAAKLMRKRKWGRIINISSMAAALEPVGDSMYAATKAAVGSLAHVMAKEFAAMNVTCNTLGITAIETDMLEQLPRDKINALLATLPVPRYATAADVLNVVDFFASEHSSSVTAQTIFLGGVN
jgi:3-oxoacyl-[acyl-carrier protein] reductase